MTASVVSNTCRLTVISPTTRVDLAVPLQMSIVELLSLVVSGLGPEVADQAIAEGGWILQRAAEPALEPSSSVAAAQLRDGDVLHLRTRSNRLPEMAFDDVLEAVASGVENRTSRWSPEHTRRAAAAMAGLLLGFTVLTCLLIGPSWTLSAVTSGAVAVLATLAAASAARVYRQRGLAITVGAYAVVNAAVCGATAVGSHRRLGDFGAPQLLVSAGAAVLVAVVILVTVSAGFAGFTAVITVGILTAIGTAIATGTSLSTSSTAAIIATVALAVSPAIPMLAFRLSRLPLPVIPTDAADLRRDTSTVDGTQILNQAARADQFLSGLVAGTAFAIAGAAAAVLTSGRGPSEYTLSTVLGVICLFRARLFTGRTQRASLLAAGSVALLAATVAGALDAHGTARVLVYVVPADLLAIVLFALAVVLPGRRYSPSVARAADLLETLLVLSVIPLALAVMGVYSRVRQATS